MTTLPGLGVDGILTFSSDYKTVKDLTSTPADARLDYYNLYHGTGSPAVNWPVPVSGNETTVDDLWHAAVNGQGTYFSAKDPPSLAVGSTRRSTKSAQSWVGCGCCHQYAGYHPAITLPT